MPANIRFYQLGFAKSYKVVQTTESPSKCDIRRITAAKSPLGS